MSELKESKCCPCCGTSKYTMLLIDDEILEVWECIDCGKTFEIRKG